jgi:hypothetical protein
MTLSQNYIIPTDRFPYSAKDVLEEIDANIVDVLGRTVACSG